MGACFGKQSQKEITKSSQNNHKKEILVPIENHESKQNKDKRFTEIRSYCESYVNGNYKRDSFNRFGDDLCELIVSYLSLKDKIQFECVNRQWNNCLYNRVFAIDYSLESRNFFSSHYSISEKQKDLILQKLVKKCKYLKRLKISTNIVYNNKFLELISQNCQFLEEIDIRFDNLKPIKTEIMSAFSTNCGPRLKSIKILELSEKCFNSEAGLSLLTQTSKTTFSEYFPKLQEIELSLDSDNCLKYFILLTDIYEQRIKSLKLRFKLSPKYKEVNQTFDLISRFNKIRKLSLIIESIDKFEVNFYEFFKKLSDNCLDLRIIDLKVKYGIFSSTPILESIEPIITLHSIRLSIHSYGIQMGSIASLGKFTNLTKLYIKDLNLNDAVLRNINYYCPNLETIALLACNQLSDISLYSLSKILNLKNICISGFHTNDITDSGIISIVNNCKKLRLIGFDCDINITKLTISTFNSMAESLPKKRYLFSFCYDITNKLNDMNYSFPTPSQLFPEIKTSPKNLKIICKLNDNNAWPLEFNHLK